jgi:D12 class N6 adenine-specific DNA methyltransferase
MNALNELRAPFPWMGGKSRAAEVIWRGFGADIVNCVEPFAGSLAVLLGRPNGPGKIETVNDLSGAICNFWRAVKTNPDAVAQWCDDPVSELDLHARHAWLVVRLDEMAEQLRADPEYFDEKVAGWWVWGICQWIGTGWCGGIKHGEPRPNLNSGQGVHAGGMHANTIGRGALSKKMPNLSGFEAGIRRPKQQIPHISVAGGSSGSMGVHGVSAALQGKQATGLPAIGDDRGINGLAAPPCLKWFRALQARLRRVRVVCGDWTRVLGPSVLGKGKNVGGRRPCAVFLDPPYDTSLRAKRIYTHDRDGLATEVRAWALANGDDPDLRICLAGYFDEHAPHMPASWSVHRWKGARGYAGKDNSNREEETLWFSPYCLPLDEQRSLFGAPSVSE